MPSEAGRTLELGASREGQDQTQSADEAKETSDGESQNVEVKKLTT